MPDIIELLKNASKVAEYQTQVERLRADYSVLKGDYDALCEELAELKATLANTQQVSWLKGRGTNFRRRFRS